MLLSGFMVFCALNLLMLQTNYELWTNPKMGFYSAFHNGFDFSGFDGHIYIVVSKWRPLFTLFRHPLLAVMMWPLATANDFLMPATGMNCAIIIVAVVWTLLSLCSWMLLHRLINKVVGLGVWTSLLLCFFYFGFAYVMMATFVPDHMIISMTLLLLTLVLACRADAKGTTMPAWQSLLLAFVSMGVSTTNCVKIWLVDMQSHLRRATLRQAFMRSLCYFVPVIIMGGLYVLQLNTTQADDHAYAKQVERDKIASNQTFAKKAMDKAKQENARHKQQTVNVKLFEWTDTSIDRLPLVIENIFGEGLILHEDHLLEDANVNRPVFVEYRHWWYYAIEGVIVCLFVCGVWCGRHERLMWMLLGILAFDALLHLGFRFAASDVYIMTAHWAFIMPVAVGCLFRRVSTNRLFFRGLLVIVGVLTLFLWYHNVSLLVHHIL